MGVCVCMRERERVCVCWGYAYMYVNVFLMFQRVYKHIVHVLLHIHKHETPSLTSLLPLGVTAVWYSTQ